MKMFGYTLSALGLGVLLYVGYAVLMVFRSEGNGLERDILELLLYSELAPGFFWLACIATYLYFVGLAIARKSRPAFFAGVITTAIFITYLMLELTGARFSSGEPGIIDIILVFIFFAGLAAVKIANKPLKERAPKSGAT